LRERKDEKVVSSLKNMKIGVFLSEHQYIEGILLDVKDDHIIVDVDHDVYYISDKHIQSITKNAKDFYVASESASYLDRQYLIDVLNEMQKSWVMINGPGNQAFCGVFSKIIDDYILLISQQELLYIPNYIITNIYSALSEEQILLKNKERLEQQRLVSLTMDKEADEADNKDSITSQTLAAEEQVSHSNLESVELTNLSLVQELEGQSESSLSKDEEKEDFIVQESEILPSALLNIVMEENQDKEIPEKALNEDLNHEHVDLVTTPESKEFIIVAKGVEEDQSESSLSKDEEKENFIVTESEILPSTSLDVVMEENSDKEIPEKALNEDLNHEHVDLVTTPESKEFIIVAKGVEEDQSQPSLSKYEEKEDFIVQESVVQSSATIDGVIEENQVKEISEKVNDSFFWM